MTQDGVDVLLPDLMADTLLADKGYDADARVIDVLQAQTKTAVMPSKLNRTIKRDYDKDLYKALINLKTFLTNSSNIVRSPPATTSSKLTFWVQFTSLLP